MKLMRITGQAEDLHQFYDQSRGWAGHWTKPISAMLELVVFLEESVDFPPQWVVTSHENLVFVGQNDHKQSLVSVYPLGEMHDGPAKAKYELHRPLGTPWSHTVGYAEDVEKASQMIVSVLLELSLEN